MNNQAYNQSCVTSKFDSNIDSNVNTPSDIERNNILALNASFDNSAENIIQKQSRNRISKSKSARLAEFHLSEGKSDEALNLIGEKIQATLNNINSTLDSLLNISTEKRELGDQSAEYNISGNEGPLEPPSSPITAELDKAVRKFSEVCFMLFFVSEKFS